ncbi:MAG: hypothetical protein ACTIOQ_13515, partial [Serratia grimesii]|uniref:hypothetical protein n=1 Tax=Serratia grimesii TaxID=82995 RepID=UPI003F9B59AA
TSSDRFIHSLKPASAGFFMPIFWVSRIPIVYTTVVKSVNIANHEEKTAVSGVGIGFVYEKL